MHPYSKMALDLKKAGYPQNLTIGNNIYLQKSDSYMEFRDVMPDEDFVIVPKLENLVSNLADLDYEAKHTVGEKKEFWTVKYDNVQFADESVWMTLCKLWLYQKGNRK